MNAVVKSLIVLVVIVLAVIWDVDRQMKAKEVRVAEQARVTRYQDREIMARCLDAAKYGESLAQVLKTGSSEHDVKPVALLVQACRSQAEATK